MSPVALMTDSGRQCWTAVPVSRKLLVLRPCSHFDEDVEQHFGQNPEQSVIVAQQSAWVPDGGKAFAIMAFALT
jgi:hypothetical protein